MKELVNRIKERLSKGLDHRLVRAGSIAMAGVLCVSLTGVFANAAMSELIVPVETEISEAAVPRSVNLELTLDTSLYADLPDVVRTEYVKSTEVIPFSIIYVEDDTMYMGESLEQSVGTDGAAEITTAMVYVNGELSESHLVNTDIVTMPQHNVILQGTKYRPVSTGTYIWPTTGTLTSGFGARGGRNHDGIDIVNDYATPVYAADAGLITRANSEYSGYGNLIWVQHDNGDVTYYAHLSSYAVSEGEYVEQGQLIGYTGSTGSSTANHLHFEIHVNGVEVDPLLYLN